MIEFGLLGPIEVARDGQPVPVGRGKRRALLALLLLNANEVISAERLIDELWGATPPGTAAKALQVHVSHLRRALEPERASGAPARVLKTKAPGYMLAIEADQLDLARFERLAAEGRQALGAGDPQRAAHLLGAGLSLWRGQPLADLAYEPFAQAAAARLDELRLGAVEDRVEAELACGRAAGVVAELEALVAAEPLRERLRGQLMLALYRAGRQAEALDAYRTARSALVSELGIEPGRDLRALHEAILRQDPSLDLTDLPDGAAAQKPSTGEAARSRPDRKDRFIGREPELSQLADALEATLAGRAATYLIGGEPGIGKTRLAEEVARLGRKRGARILWGRCWEAGGAPAYWPWVQVLRAYLAIADNERLRSRLDARTAELTQLLPEMRERFPELPAPASPESESARFRLFDATVEFVRRVAADAPLMLVLDDLHAADTPSLLMLRFVASELGDVPVFVLGTYRDVEVGPAHPLARTLAALSRQPTTHTIALGGLDEHHVSRLIESTAAITPSRRVVSAIHRRTAGNPLFVGQLLQLLGSEGGLEEATGDGPRRLGIPRGIHEVIGKRLEAVSADCRRTLRVAAVLGREFGLAELAALTGRLPTELLDVLDESLTERIVDEVTAAPERLRFSHVLIRDVLYDELGMSRRRRLHSRAGEALEALHGPEPEPHLAELAYHFFEAGPAGDPTKALEYARRAAEHAAAQLAYEEAARLYELALRVLRTGSSADRGTRCELTLRLGEARLRAGDEEEAKELFLQAAEMARQLGDAEASARAALGYSGLIVWMASRGDPHLVPLIEQALAALPEADGDLRARLLARLSCAVRDRNDRARRLPLGDAAIEMARRLGDDRTLAYALEARCVALVDPDSLELLTETGREAVAIAERTGELAFTGDVALFASLLQTGDVPGAKRASATIARHAQMRQEPTYRWAAACIEAALALFEGQFVAARPLIERAHDVGRDAERFLAVTAHALQDFLLERECGEVARTADALRELAAEYPNYHILRCALANVYVEVGDGDGARAIFDDLAREDFAQVYYDEEFLPSMSLLAEVCATLDDRGRAAAIYEQLLPHAQRNAFGIIEFALGAVARPLGLLAATLDRPRAAADHLEAAISMNGRMGARPWTAHARFALGRVLLDTTGRERERADALLRDALAEYTQLGMRPWQAKAERALAQGAAPAA